jgi:hypothetical protein
VLAAACLALAGCGAGDDAGELQTVEGRGFRFSAPAAWTVTERGRSSAAAPGGDAPDVVSVTVFRLARAYDPAEWNTVVPELDRVAGELAERLEGTLAASATVTVAGRRARRYDIRYDRGDDDLVERTAFVLDGRQEYQLVCRYRVGEPPDACDALFETFALA